MRIFVKRECLLAAKTAYKLITLDVSKKDNLVAPEKIKLPTATNDLVMKTVLCPKEKVVAFKVSCVQILINIILKLQERCPLKFSVIRNSSCLSPNNMVGEQESSILKFKYLVDKLFQSKHLSAKEADAAKYQYDDFLKSVVKGNSECFLQFSFKTTRLDEFLGTYFNRNEKFKELWKICIFIFT